MYPLDPAEIAQQNESPMAPPYVDENPNVELTNRGMRIAENEKRDTITRGYEEAAVESDETEEALDDISYPAGGNSSKSPEVRAMKEERPPATE